MIQDYTDEGCPEVAQGRNWLPSSQCTLTLREFIISLKPMEIRMPPRNKNWITFHQTKQIQSSATFVLKLNSWLPGKILQNIFHPIVWNAPQRSKNYLVLALAAKVPPSSLLAHF